jgi:beta propeller repeat protein
MGGPRFAGCEIDPQSGACAASELTGVIAPLSRPAASGSLSAWVELNFRRTDPLKICELDPESGECPEVLLATGVHDRTPDLSGNRLVWDGRVGDQASDVFFCEYDRVLQDCPVQRITAHLGEQVASAIDGNRVVWEDDREGGSHVYSIELPELAPIRDRRVAEGRLLWIPVRASAGGRDDRPLTLAAEAVGEASLEELGAELVPLRAGRRRGVSRAALRWRPRFDQAGDYAITLSATTHGGLVTRHTVRIAVVDADRPGSSHPRPKLTRLHRAFARWWREIARGSSGS